MDDLDHLADREELAGPARIAACRKPVGPMPTGKCLNCEIPIVQFMTRWCSDDCFEDWSKRKRADAQKWPK